MWNFKACSRSTYQISQTELWTYNAYICMNVYTIAGHACCIYGTALASNMLTAVVHHTGSLCRNHYAEKVFI